MNNLVNTSSSISYSRTNFTFCYFQRYVNFFYKHRSLNLLFAEWWLWLNKSADVEYKSKSLISFTKLTLKVSLPTNGKRWSSIWYLCTSVVAGKFFASYGTFTVLPNALAYKSRLQVCPSKLNHTIMITKPRKENITTLLIPSFGSKNEVVFNNILTLFKLLSCRTKYLQVQLLFHPSTKCAQDEILQGS